MEKPLVNKKYKLAKWPGKGGWTYTIISGIPPELKGKMGMVRVKGLIDDYEISQYNLFPLKDGNFFLPVKAAIRKVIRKEAGDTVKVVLFADNDPLTIPDELLQCLRDEPAAHKTFYSFSVSEQKQYIDWIYSAKQEETRVARIATTIDRLLRGLAHIEKRIEP